MEKSQRPPNIVLFPSPGMGHLIPLAEFAKRFRRLHGVTVTIIVFSDFSHAQSTFLHGLPDGVSYVTLPPIPLDRVPADARVVTRLSVMASRAVPHVRDILLDVKKSARLVAYFADIFAGDTLPTAKELGVPHYLLFTTNFMTLHLLLQLPALDEATCCEYRDLPEVKFPGCVPLRGEDLMEPIQDRSNDVYKWMLNAARRLREVDGILVNSFADGLMEAAAYEALLQDEPGRPPVRPVGPLTCHDGREGGKGSTECKNWLDSQPDGSVLYISFGSGGILSDEQMRELAMGLEESGQRFLWVACCPSDKDAASAYLGFDLDDDPLSYLPDGFLDRTRDVGLVVPFWAPQVEVLSHHATGGFLAHCGWNSSLESLVNGVPMIAWPLYSEQRMNAVLLVEGVGVALRAKAAGSHGAVSREEVSKVVKELMEGEEGTRVRNRARELQTAAAKALEKGGSSYNHLAELAGGWKDAVVA